MGTLSAATASYRPPARSRRATVGEVDGRAVGRRHRRRRRGWPANGLLAVRQCGPRWLPVWTWRPGCRARLRTGRRGLGRRSGPVRSGFVGVGLGGVALTGAGGRGRRGRRLVRRRTPSQQRRCRRLTPPRRSASDSPAERTPPPPPEHRDPHQQTQRSVTTSNATLGSGEGQMSSVAVALPNRRANAVTGVFQW